MPARSQRRIFVAIGLAERERFELSVRFDGPMLSSISRTDDPGSRYCRSSGAHGPVLPEYFIAISRIPAAFALAPLALSWARAAIKRRSSCYLSQKGLDIGFERSGTVRNFGRWTRSEIQPRRRRRCGGALVVRRRPQNRNGGSHGKISKEACACPVARTHYCGKAGSRWP